MLMAGAAERFFFFYSGDKIALEFVFTTQYKIIICILVEN